MSLEQALRELWNSSDTLPALVPVTRVWTGQAVDKPASLPYVVLRRLAEENAAPCGGPVRARVRLVFAVYAAELDAGRELCAQLRQRFHRTGFQLVDGEVLDMAWRKNDEHAERDGVWRIECEFSVVIEYT
jgi:hypothetical protein